MASLQELKNKLYFLTTDSEQNLVYLPHIEASELNANITYYLSSLFKYIKSNFPDMHLDTTWAIFKVDYDMHKISILNDIALSDGITGNIEGNEKETPSQARFSLGEKNFREILVKKSRIFREDGVELLKEESKVDLVKNAMPIYVFFYAISRYLEKDFKVFLTELQVDQQGKPYFGEEKSFSTMDSENSSSTSSSEITSAVRKVKATDATNIGLK